MAVAFDSSGKLATGATSTVMAVCSFTGAAGAVLLAAVSTASTVSISACVVNGVSMTQLGRIVNDGGAHQATLYGLTTPPTGVLSLSASMVGGGAAIVNIMAATYTGARTTNPFGTIITLTAGAVTGAAISISSSTTDRVVVFTGGVNSFSFTATEASTRQTDGQHNTYRWVDAAGASPGVSLSASSVNTSQNLAWIGLNVAASIAGQTVCYMSLLGVGN